MTDRKQKQITILAIILGLLTLSFIVVASTATAFVILVDPTPTKITTRVASTIVVQKGGTSFNWGPGTPSPTIDPTKFAESRNKSATFIAKQARHFRTVPTSVPPFVKTIRKLDEIEIWGETLGIILLLMFITSVMLYSQLGKQD